MTALPGMARPTAGIGSANLAIDAARKLGFLSSLKLCLDAADAASYPGGTEQAWSDRSGGGYHFNRGSGSGSDAADPTFNGAAGDLGAYWSFDGGDWFTLGQANPAWLNSLHKDNAAWWVLAGLYPVVGGGAKSIFGTAVSASDVGVSLQYSAAGAAALIVFNGSGSVARQNNLGTLADQQWHVLGYSFDETVGSGGDIRFINGAVAAGDSTVASPSAANATHTAQIGARNGSVPIASGSRLAFFLAGEGEALTAQQMLAFHEATRGRFGI